MLGIMNVVLVLGIVIGAAGTALDAAPVQLFVTRNVTSRPLGSLAPGYASTVRGYRVYSGLIRAFGLALIGVWIASVFPPGALVFVIGVAGFAYNTIRAIRGEVRTYRGLKR